MSMRDYRNPPWVSAPSYMVPQQYAPPPHPQSISPIEQAILNLTKLVGDVVEEQKKFNAQLSKKIYTVESSLNKRLDVLQSNLEKKIDIMQHSISRLTIQHGHQEEENLEGEWLIDQDKLMQKSVEAPEELPTGEAGGGRGKEAGEEPQEPILQPIPMNLNPSATAQPQNSPLPVYILPTPTTQPTPGAPTGKATSISLPVLQKFKKLVTNVRAFDTTSKTMAAAHIAWHSG